MEKTDPLNTLTEFISDKGDALMMADVPQIESLSTQLGDEGFEIYGRICEGLSLTVQSPDYTGDIPADYFEYND